MDSQVSPRFLFSWRKTAGEGGEGVGLLVSGRPLGQDHSSKNGGGGERLLLVLQGTSDH